MTSMPGLDEYLVYYMEGETVHSGIDSGQGGGEGPHILQVRTFILTRCISPNLVAHPTSGRRRHSLLGLRRHISKESRKTKETSALLFGHTSSEEGCRCFNIGGPLGVDAPMRENREAVIGQRRALCCPLCSGGIMDWFVAFCLSLQMTCNLSN